MIQLYSSKNRLWLVCSFLWLICSCLWLVCDSSVVLVMTISNIQINLFAYSSSYNLTPAASWVLIDQHLIFCSPTWPACCSSPRKCTAVKYKARQKAVSNCHIDNLLITKLFKFFKSFSPVQIKKHFWNRKIFWIF